MTNKITEPELDVIFAALGNLKRLGMIYSLSLQPATVRKLADDHKLTLPAIHKHVRILETAKLIQRKKVGRTNFVAINRSSLKAAQSWLQQFRTDWGNDSESLENYIARMRE